VCMALVQEGKIQFTGDGMVSTRQIPGCGSFCSIGMTTELRYGSNNHRHDAFVYDNSNTTSSDSNSHLFHEMLFL
jgi:hypothetical protein